MCARLNSYFPPDESSAQHSLEKTKMADLVTFRFTAKVTLIIHGQKYIFKKRETIGHILFLGLRGYRKLNLHLRGAGAGAASGTLVS